MTWLNLFLAKSNPPTKALTEPSCGLMATNAPSTSGSWVISQVPLGVCTTRITAPRLILMFGPALSERPDWAGFKPSPVISSCSAFWRMATIFLGLASNTTADMTSPLSGWSSNTSSMASSNSFGLVGNSMNFSGPRYTCRRSKSMMP